MLRKDKTIKRSDRITFVATKPMKMALTALAYGHGMTLTDLIYKALLLYCERQYPDELVRYYESEFAKINN